MQRSCRNHAGNNYNRFRKLYDQYGEEGLQEISRKKPLLKNRVAAEIEEAVIDYAIEYPAYGQLRAGNELKKKGIFISPGGVRNVWLRHNLQNMKVSLRALEEKLAKENFILTESQLKALEKAKEEKVAYGEIETLFPGYHRIRGASW